MTLALEPPEGSWERIIYRKADPDKPVAFYWTELFYAPRYATETTRLNRYAEIYIYFHFNNFVQYFYITIFEISFLFSRLNLPALDHFYFLHCQVPPYLG